MCNEPKVVEARTVKCEPKGARTRRFPRVDEPTYLYITMLANLVNVLNDSAISDDRKDDLAEEVLNAAYILRTGAEV